ncbi:hypothetical protein BGZ97_000764 [Linnemannia gamsii]|uniref:Uncharacterized protein n=1 Tax=Linnemannia gamsii TaxID=64522 RepID=A0A9P6UJY2_9FUNG|nr:hypothetical protein BGZ97_000764 [Linnemannia gamsii]
MLPGYIDFTEPALNEVFYASPNKKRIVDAIVGTRCYPGALSKNYTGYNNAMFCTQRGLLIEVLFGHRGYPERNGSIRFDTQTNLNSNSNNGNKNNSNNNELDELDDDVPGTMDDDDLCLLEDNEEEEQDAGGETGAADCHD